MKTARAFAIVTVQDPEQGGTVEVQMYRHENGGIFGIDASFLTNGGVFDLVDPTDEDSDPIIPDPFAVAVAGESLRVRLSETRAWYNGPREAIS